jgi:enamine deaminase RidA (YjgF/YER057c/UK114 family)
MILKSHSEKVISLNHRDLDFLLKGLNSFNVAGDVSAGSSFVFAGRDLFKKCAGTASPSENITWLEGDTSCGEVFSAQCVLISNAEFSTVSCNGKNIGFAYEDADGQFLRLCGVVPDDIELPPEKQAESLFKKISDVMESRGFKFSDIVRTWFYNRKILDWYKGFNSARTKFFEENGVFEKLVPASTGIGAANPFNSALSADFLAIKPKGGRIEIKPIESPLQSSAMSYRSSFSRAIEIKFPEYRKLLISGTASIDKDGASMHKNDCRKQIDKTMEVISAILKSRNMRWQDATRAIAYFKNKEDIHLFEEHCGEKSIPEIPVIFAQAAICREELLFEIEVDAATLRFGDLEIG